MRFANFRLCFISENDNTRFASGIFRSKILLWAVVAINNRFLIDKEWLVLLGASQLLCNLIYCRISNTDAVGVLSIFNF